MADPAGGPPPQGSSNWQTPPPPPPSGFQAPPVAAGPAPGVAYADLVMRIVAYIIDSILLSIVTFFVAAIIGVAILASLLTGGFVLAIVGALVLAVVVLALSAVYFVYTWTTMRASPGQKILNLETVNAADGATLTRDQAIRRWAFLFGPQALASVGQFALGATDAKFLGPILSLLAFVYTIYLLYSTSQSPKRQGFHDVQAGTVVVKRVG
jgi:uncharacterized RDD family membrane protein YckC